MARTGQRTPGHPAIHRPGPARPATSATPAAEPPPIATPDRLQYETRWPRSLLAQGFETIVPVQSLCNPRATPRVFQVEVANPTTDLPLTDDQVSELRWGLWERHDGYWRGR